MMALWEATQEAERHLAANGIGSPTRPRNMVAGDYRGAVALTSEECEPPLEALMVTRAEPVSRYTDLELVARLLRGLPNVMRAGVDGGCAYVYRWK